MANKREHDIVRQKSTGVVICTACLNDKVKKKTCDICGKKGYVPKP